VQFIQNLSDHNLGPVEILASNVSFSCFLNFYVVTIAMILVKVPQHFTNTAHNVFVAVM